MACACILVVDDDDDLRDAMSRILRASGYNVSAAESGRVALEKLESEDCDLVLLDVHMPGMSGIEVLEKMRARCDFRPVIMISAAGSIDTAVRAVQLGALDFLEKPARKERLMLSLENALRFSRLSRDHDALQARHGEKSNLIGSSEVMQDLRSLISKVAQSEGRVLILGENGTGKELAANAIHAESARKAQPFVKVNCGAIPDELIESELFGHEKGAFTGAIGQRRGKFELAHRGTLFLDEIGDMPAPMQVKLLRVLQEGTFERVGGTKSLEVDVRVIAATNRDLAKMVQAGTFREDLYYRLNVVTIHMPALRDRPSDIPELARVLLRRAQERNGRKPFDIEPAALEVLSHLTFAGNVRELSNLMERLVIMGNGSSIRVEDLAFLTPPSQTRPAKTDVAFGYLPGTTYKECVRRAEREILSAAIRAFGGNKSAAARALGLERAHFAKKCRAVGLVDHEADSTRG